MSKALDDLRDALYGTTLVQPISHEGRGGSLGVLCRQVPGQEKAFIRLVDEILAQTQHWTTPIHLCRRYVRKDDRMVFGWFLGVEAKSAADLVKAVQELTPILARGPVIGRVVAEEQVLAPPTPVKKYVSQYADKTPQAVKDADGEQVESAPQRTQREFENGPDPVAPKNFKPQLRVLAVGTDERGKRTTIEEMQLPHTYKDNNIPQPGSTKGAYGGGFTAPKRSGNN